MSQQMGMQSIACARLRTLCLDLFCAASSEKVSYQKSMIYFLKILMISFAGNISHELNMSIIEDLGKYLEMPTIHGRVTKHTFQQVTERVDKRLAW